LKKPGGLIDSETKHISAGKAQSIYGEEVWSSYTKFSIVRNPWNRVISMWTTKWWHQSSENCSFYEFIKTLKSHPNEKYKSLYYHEILNEKLDFTLRFESLQSDFNLMLRKIGSKDKGVPIYTRIRRRLGSRDIELPVIEKQIVAEIFNTDIIKFGYCF
jgi:hypothetical protein